MQNYELWEFTLVFTFLLSCQVFFSHAWRKQLHCKDMCIMILSVCFYSGQHQECIYTKQPFEWWQGQRQTGLNSFWIDHWYKKAQAEVSSVGKVMIKDNYPDVWSKWTKSLFYGCWFYLNFYTRAVWFHEFLE